MGGRQGQVKGETHFKINFCVQSKEGPPIRGLNSTCPIHNITFSYGHETSTGARFRILISASGVVKLRRLDAASCRAPSFDSAMKKLFHADVKTKENQKEKEDIEKKSKRKDSVRKDEKKDEKKKRKDSGASSSVTKAKNSDSKPIEKKEVQVTPVKAADSKHARFDGSDPIGLNNISYFQFLPSNLLFSVIVAFHLISWMTCFCRSFSMHLILWLTSSF